MKTPLGNFHAGIIHSGTSGQGLRRCLVQGIAVLVVTVTLVGHGGDQDKDDKQSNPRNIVYITSNNPEPGKNSVIAYRRDAVGNLTLLGNFPTRGTGFFNNDERLGPDDSDQEIMLSEDHRFLYAVNSGSDTIAAFEIKPDGSLAHLKGSPFPSRGVQPVSIGLDGHHRMFVVNKGNLEPGQTGGESPNYAGFQVHGDGRISPITKSFAEVNPGSHPTQALLAPGGKILFGVNLFTYYFPPPPGFPPFAPSYASALESFVIRPDGRLKQGANTPQPIPLGPPVPPFMLGLAVHPKEPFLYVGYVLGGALATYRYDQDGTLTFLNAAPTTGLGLCWVEVNKKGTVAYTSNSTDDSIAVFSLTDPAKPVEIQKVDLKGPKAFLCPDPTPCAPVIFTTTPFQLELDPAGKFLFVLNHETTPDDSFPNGNALHILQVAPDGKLSELSSSPLILPPALVPAGAHPKGVTVL